MSEYAHEGYLQAIHRAGGRPIKFTADSLLSEFDECDGLLIPGGVDVCPLWYGQQPLARTQSPQLNRDSIELALIRRAINNKMPVLGICRGHQLINVAMGGTLVQDMPHSHDYKHAVVFKDARILVVEDGNMFVNSMHHQAINKVGDGLQAVAWAEDGTIEAIEGTGDQFIVGVQWHPEVDLTPKFNREMLKLFRMFTNAKEVAKEKHAMTN